MMERQPITRQRSPWEHIRNGDVLGYTSQWWGRNTAAGVLSACVAEEPEGWHLSISFTDHRGQRSRYPTWDEIAHAREELLPMHLDFVMWLPQIGHYVALHDTTFHLHEHPPRPIP